jgi:hypothetical protein
MKNILRSVIIFLILTACGYDPIYSFNGTDFGLTEVKMLNQNSTTRQIGAGLRAYKENNNKKRLYVIEIFSNEENIVTSKNSRGNETSFRKKITVLIKVYENKKILKSKTFVEEFNYANNENKFELKKYENNIEKNLINKIIENIILELYKI